MRIIFVHRTIVDYNVETPYQRAVGGTEAGVAYLGAELARLGHSVVLLASPSVPGIYRGVECLNHKVALTRDLLNGADAIIVVNEACGRTLRDLGVTKPLVLWTGHSDDQPSIEPLEYSRERKAWSGFAFVSQWQLNEYCNTFWLPREKARVMRNAISPAFLEAKPAEPWFRTGKAPILVYTSAPYRGLDVLLAAFPAIRAAIPGTVLRVFSSLSTTRGGPEDNRYKELHDRCLATEGVDYVGPVSQPALATALTEAAALSYPSTYLETSCIAAMEAMALGATVLTTELAALPETLAGFGRMVRPHDDPKTLAQEFAAMAIGALNDIKNNPDQAASRRAEQIAYVRKNYVWPPRALEWQSWLLELIAKR
ncbi:MAG TPA: glycosyltransferase family 4 protein [Micropepsaceae bacterium]|nr:glycosyltransferase family 4 protein [Micropepsaceae bacterium]